MPKKPLVIPRFKTEAEEAEWWDANPEVATGIMKRAIKAGKARRVVPLKRAGAAANHKVNQKQVRGGLRCPRILQKTVTMRLPVRDIEAARELAARKSLPYQTYIKMLLHEALEKERRSA